MVVLIDVVVDAVLSHVYAVTGFPQVKNSSMVMFSFVVVVVIAALSVFTFVVEENAVSVLAGLTGISFRGRI